MVTPVLNGGYVLGGGAICMELLTRQVHKSFKKKGKHVFHHITFEFWHLR